MDDLFPVTCPYCGETVEIYVEPDVTRLVRPGLRSLLQPLEDPCRA